MTTNFSQDFVEENIFTTASRVQEWKHDSFQTSSGNNGKELDLQSLLQNNCESLETNIWRLKLKIHIKRKKYSFSSYKRKIYCESLGRICFHVRLKSLILRGSSPWQNFPGFWTRLWDSAIRRRILPDSRSQTRARLLWKRTVKLKARGLSPVDETTA